MPKIEKTTITTIKYSTEEFLKLLEDKVFNGKEIQIVFETKESDIISGASVPTSISVIFEGKRKGR